MDEFVFAYTENAADDLKNLLQDNGKKAARKAVHEALKKIRLEIKCISFQTTVILTFSK